MDQDRGGNAGAPATQAEAAATWALGLCLRADRSAGADREAGASEGAWRPAWPALAALAEAVERGDDVPAAQVARLAGVVREALGRQAPDLARAVDAQAALAA